MVDDADRAGLEGRARRWMDADPDPHTRAELNALLEAEDWAELAERMDGSLEFGTAGLRGRVEAGSNRMNRAVVIRTTAGLASFLGDRPGPVVVGFDGRSSSPTFAEDTIGVLVAAGREVRYFPEPVPTPLVAFAAKEADAAAAVVITASHNPPADNGYKVYDSNAAQIVPPVDRDIAEAIDRVPAAASIERVQGVFDGTSDLAVPIDLDDVYHAYRRAVDALRTVPRSGTGGYPIAYTPIHGVGWRIVRRLMADAGYDAVSVVASQRDPDGSFPTVTFPNPEEPGAMDEVLSLAEETRSRLVLANDPDADRLAVAVPHGDGYTMLTGNQIGLLMADRLLEAWAGSTTPIVINSIVSSPMLGKIAALHDARFEQTLTGFKWISNAAMDLEAAGEGTFLFGYEEALGYTVGSVVRDKDGMSAALLFADMAVELDGDGRTIVDRLADLYRRAGLWVSGQTSVLRPGSEGEQEIVVAMRRIGEDAPERLGERTVTGVTDYRRGADRRPRWLPATSLVALDLDDGGRVLVRPSGTEPKLKIYVDLPGEPGTDVDAAEPDLRAQADRLGRTVVEYLELD